MKVTLHCDMCGREFQKWSSKITRHNFCSRECLADFSSKTRNPTGYADLKDFTNISAAFTKWNSETNKSRMTEAVREKLRRSRYGSGDGKTYLRSHGRHEHRGVAEQILGRPLLSGEVVHHIDGNKRNNSPENLMVFASQSEHARFHAELKRQEKGGNAK